MMDLPAGWVPGCRRIGPDSGRMRVVFASSANSHRARRWPVNNHNKTFNVNPSLQVDW